MQCRLEVAAELQQRWRRTNRRRVLCVCVCVCVCRERQKARLALREKDKKVLLLGAGYVSAPVVDYLTRDEHISVTVGQPHNLDTIRYDTRCYFNVRSKADISQLNLPHGTDN